MPLTLRMNIQEIAHLWVSLFENSLVLMVKVASQLVKVASQLFL